VRTTDFCSSRARHYAITTLLVLRVIAAIAADSEPPPILRSAFASHLLACRAETRFAWRPAQARRPESEGWWA
jgi:integrase